MRPKHSPAALSKNSKVVKYRVRVFIHLASSIRLPVPVDDFTTCKAPNRKSHAHGSIFAKRSAT